MRANGIDEQQEDREPVGERRRVLEGSCAEFGVEEAAAVVPSCLIASMKPIGPRAMVWVTPFRASWMLTGPGEGLDGALADEDDRRRRRRSAAGCRACSG